MRKLYGPTSWRRVLSLALVFAMMFSIMGTSGFSVFAEEENLPEAIEEVVEAPAEEESEAPEEAVLEEPADEAEPAAPADEPAEEAEPEVEEEALPEEESSEEPAAVEEGEEGDVTEEAAEPAEEAEEGEEPEEGAEPEEAVEPEEAAEPAEEAEEEGEEPAEAVEEAEEDEEGEEEVPAEVIDVTEEETLIAEAAQVILSDDGSEAPAEEAEPAEEAVEEEAAEEAAEEAGSVVDEFVKGVSAEPAEEPAEEVAEPVEEAVAEEAVEEIPEEVEEEPEIAYPAMGFRDIIGGISVTVDAPEGAFPEGTEMKLAEVEIETIIDAVADAVEGEIAKIKAVDITFFYKGEEIQPMLPINVVMNASGMTADSERQVLHIDDEGEATVVEDADTSKKAVAFEADSFSVYVVVVTVVPRYFVTFKNGSTTVAEMIVKAADTAKEIEEIIYDPGAGTIPAGQVFKGWATTATYTADSTLLTIEQIRTDAKAAAAALTNENGSITYYAALFSSYTITYQSDDAQPITVGTDAVEFPSYNTAAQVDYTVKMGYPVDDTHNFEGWMALDSASQGNIVNYPAGAKTETVTVDGQTTTLTYYENDTDITIKGDVEFTVKAPEGGWLIFDENGKGGKYNAAQFVLKGLTTSKPCDDADMTRYGYSFAGWYYFPDGATVPEQDAHKSRDLTDALPFTFGETLVKTTTIYAKWTPNEQAPYTVIFWKQNLDRNGYEVAGSYAAKPEDGIVGQNIPFNVIENGDEDYVARSSASSDAIAYDFGTYQDEHGRTRDHGHYTGFCLTDASKTQEVAITPEGDAVLNLYYDRITYNFKFYLYRDGTQNNSYDYANNSANGSTLDGLVSWHTNQNAHPSANGYTIKSETVGGRTYYYFTIEAFYGQDISTIWPTYDKFVGANNREAVSYVMMVGTFLKPNPSADGDGTVKGLITVMNDNILGATNDKNGNYVVVRFPGNYNNWRYHIWFETIPGETYPEGTTHTHNGRTYYEETVLEVRSSNTTDANQNEPKYTGFDYVTRLGQNADGSTWQGGHWTTGTGTATQYHLNYIYNRQTYTISYFDGVYTDGNNNTLQVRSANPLHESDSIAQGAVIPDDLKNYVPDLPAGEEGYVFEGWYLDEGCTTPYPWIQKDEEEHEIAATMPVGGITVYAKWRQIQYRAFLHTGIEPGDDTNLSWGNEGQALSFRVSYGGHIDTPTGTRDGYKFLGWYKNEACTDPFSGAAFVFNEQTVPDGEAYAYDHTEIMTDPETKVSGVSQYGPWDVETADAWNSDATGWDSDGDEKGDSDRFWITKKFDVYAKWSKVLEGADGIKVIYNAEGFDLDGKAVEGSKAPTDNAIYIDNSNVSAGPAATAPSGYIFDHWTVETWDGSKYVYDDNSQTALPGETFAVKGDDAKVVQKDSTGTDGKPQYEYTVEVIAIYKALEEKTPTHISWYSNYGSENDGKGILYRYDLKENGEDVLSINAAVDILEAQTRTNYTFKGWTKTKGGTEPWLYYNAEDSKFYTESGFQNAAAQVAADQKPAIEDLFAVWEEDTVTIKYRAVAVNDEVVGAVSLAEETVGVETGKPAGSTASAINDNYEFAYWSVDRIEGPISTDVKYVPSKNGDVYEAHTYYAHFNAKYTINHYLLGTETAVKDAETGAVALGEKVTPTYADTYNGYKLSHDLEANPAVPVTIETAGQIITIYYTLPLTIEAKSDSKEYDGKALDGEYTITGALESDQAAIEAALGDAPSITNVSESPKDYLTEAEQPAIGKQIPGYYEVEYTSGTLEITPAPVTVTADSKAKAYGDDDPELTATVKGTIGQDTVAYEIDRDPGEEVGEYTITPAGDARQGNYTVEYKTGTLKITGEGHLTVEKKTTSTPENGKTYALGEEITYTITVKNDGARPINNITVTDEFTGDKWTIQSLAQGESSDAFTASHVVTEADILEGSVVNEATATGKDPNGDDPEVIPGTTEDPTDPKNSHITITKKTTSEPANGETYAVGETITYTITATNDGNMTLTGVKVTDDLTGDEWTIEEDFAPGATETFTAKHEVTEEDANDGKVVNEATATGKDPEGKDPEVVPGTTEDPVEPPAPVEETKYTIVYNSNYSSYSDEADKTGTDGPATSLTILGPDDRKLGFAEKDGEDLIWKLGDKTFKFVGWTTARKGGDSYEIGAAFPKAEKESIVQAATSSFRSFLRMAASSSEGTAADAAADLTLYAQWEEVAAPKLVIEKVVTSKPENGEYYVAGETVEYQITVTNKGNVEITDITVEDDHDVTVVEGSMTIDSLKPDESKIIKVTYTVKEAEVGETLKNVATAKGIVPDTKEEVPAEDSTAEVPTGKPDEPAPDPTPSRDRDRTPRDEEEPIDEGDTPLAPAEEEEPIDEGDTPLAPAEEEEEPVEEEATPFSPYTGDDRHTAVWGFVSLLSLAGIVVVSRKRREEE